MMNELPGKTAHQGERYLRFEPGRAQDPGRGRWRETIHTGDTQDEVPVQIQPNLWLLNSQERGEQVLRHTIELSFVAYSAELPSPRGDPV